MECKDCIVYCNKCTLCGEFYCVYNDIHICHITEPDGTKVSALDKLRELVKGYKDGRK
jgi:hypothetical protein